MNWEGSGKSRYWPSGADLSHHITVGAEKNHEKSQENRCPGVRDNI
jgi:hypothetical protein